MSLPPGNSLFEVNTLSKLSQLSILKAYCVPADVRGLFPILSRETSHNPSGKRLSFSILHKRKESLWEVREVLKVTRFRKRCGFKPRQLIPDRNFLQPATAPLKDIRNP